MHWVVQEDIFKEKQYTELLSFLDKYNIFHSIVKVVPFAHTLIPDIDPEGLIYVCGSTSMMLAAKKKGWFPGSFYNSNFDFSIWQHKYSCVNSDSGVIALRDVHEWVWQRGYSEFFIRPTGDEKQFAGLIMDIADLLEWQENLIKYQDDLANLDINTQVVVASIKNITKEIRFFVVDNKIVTGSQYKANGRVYYSDIIDPDAFEFAESQIKLWAPARAFVIDVGLVEVNDEFSWQVIEINNINSAGFYSSDISKIIQAIENMEFPNQYSFE